MPLDRGEMKRLIKEKGIKSLDDFTAFMRDISSAWPSKRRRGNGPSAYRERPVIYSQMMIFYEDRLVERV